MPGGGAHQVARDGVADGGRGARGHFGREGGEYGGPVGAWIQLARQPGHRPEHLLGPRQQLRRPARASVEGPQGRLSPARPIHTPPPQSPADGPSRPPCASRPRSVPTAIIPVPAAITAPGRGPSAPTYAVTASAAERDPPHAEFALQRGGQLGPQCIAEGGEPRRSDGHGPQFLRPGDRHRLPGPWRRLIQQMSGVDAARAGAAGSWRSVERRRHARARPVPPAAPSHPSPPPAHRPTRGRDANGSPPLC